MMEAISISNSSDKLLHQINRAENEIFHIKPIDIVGK